MITNQNISIKDTIVQSLGNIVSNMDGEKVMMNIEHGKYYNLGKIGGRIWELMETPTSVTQLVNTLISEYKVAQAECEEQVISFLEQMCKEGLIHYEAEAR